MPSTSTACRRAPTCWWTWLRRQVRADPPSPRARARGAFLLSLTRRCASADPIAMSETVQTINVAGARRVTGHAHPQLAHAGEVLTAGSPRTDPDPAGVVPECKILLVGDAGVGKSSFVRALRGAEFDTAYIRAYPLRGGSVPCQCPAVV